MVWCSEWWQFKNCMRLTSGICIQRTLFFFSPSLFVWVEYVFVLLANWYMNATCTVQSLNANSHRHTATLILTGTERYIVSLLFTNVSFRCAIISIFRVGILYFVTFCGRQNQEKVMALFRHWCTHCSIFFMCTFNLATAGQFIQTNNDRHDCANAIWLP